MADSVAIVAAVRQAVREELRRCGIRPPSPPGPGAWDAEADAWIALPPPEAPAAPPARAGA